MRDASDFESQLANMLARDIEDDEERQDHQRLEQPTTKAPPSPLVQPYRSERLPASATHQGDEHQAELQKMMDSLFRASKLDDHDALEVDLDDGLEPDSESLSPRENATTQPTSHTPQVHFVNASRVLPAMAPSKAHHYKEDNATSDNSNNEHEDVNSGLSMQPSVGGLVRASEDEPFCSNEPTSRDCRYTGHVMKRRVVEGAAIEEEIEVEFDVPTNLVRGETASTSISSSETPKTDVTLPTSKATKDSVKVLANSTPQPEEHDDGDATVKEVLTEAVMQAATIATNEVAASQHASSVADTIMSQDTTSTPSTASAGSSDHDSLPLKVIATEDESRDVEEKLVADDQSQLSEQSRPALFSSNAQRGILEKIFYSAFEPGVNDTVLMVVNIVFACLFLCLLSLAIMTGGSLHVLFMLGVSAALFGMLIWFVRAVAQETEQTHAKAE
ncbi:hypothetical protein SeMB42_g01928 [Synchytrium endobioticum]|uniref:Transmembrane protein n=1 Tax=Synchytrium endobioticum TaxID=286115 RepID=A0A507DIM3_9FUNG|nr:hypothetical protein SeMB42_g01928 [Synchytrium endobioticum]